MDGNAHQFVCLSTYCITALLRVYKCRHVKMFLSSHEIIADDLHMKLTNTQIVLLLIGGMLLITFPPGFAVFFTFVGLHYLLKSLNPHNKNAPTASDINPESTDLSPTQQTYIYLRNYLHTPNASPPSIEQHKLSDREHEAWLRTVEELSKDN